MKKKKQVPMQIVLPPDLKAMLFELAAKNGVSAAHIIKESVKETLRCQK